jgi:hypothetical protein
MGWAVLHDAGVPLEEAVLVLDEVRQSADDGVHLEPMGARLLLWVLAQAEIAQDRQEEEEEQEKRRR